MEEPPSKKIKPDSWSTKMLNIPGQLHIKEIKAILADEYTQEIQYTSVYVTNILDKKKISDLVKALTKFYPLDDLQHLKRVRFNSETKMMEIILYPVSVNPDMKKVDLNSLCNEINMDKFVFNDLKVISVPKNAPKTRTQFENSSKTWPVSFHENKYIAKLIKDEVFRDKKRELICSYVKETIVMAKVGEITSNEAVGTLIVDPVTNCVVAKSHDCTSVDILKTSVMVAVDLVARSQGGGYYNLPEHYDKLYYKDCVSNIIDKTGPYLCTGYDLYTTHEPDIMEAMALVHSRISRVFYLHSTPWGALGSLYKLHTINGLNHHYEAFKVIITDFDSG